MATSPTLANLLTQMYEDKEVLSGWDAVLNLLESAVNDFFLTQWNSHTSNAGKMKVATIWCDGVSHVGDQYVTDVIQLVVEFGQPLFQFASGSDSVTVRQDILSGTLKTGVKPVTSSFSPPSCGCPMDDPSVQWNPPVTIDTSTKPYLSGTVPLGLVQGLVNASSHSLVLDFAKGAFTLNNLTVTGVKNTTIVDQLKDWFASNKIAYILASVDFSNVAGTAALTPTSFKFGVVKTNAGNTVVQLLMTTNGSQPSQQPIVDEPIPTADKLTCSLMVSSRILYNNVLVSGFNKPNAQFRLVATPEANNAWSAVISPPMVFTGSFTFGSCCSPTKVNYNIPLGGQYTGSPTTGFSLSQHESTAPVHVNISVSAAYPVQLSGSGASQTLTIQPGTPTVTVSGSAEAAIKSRLQNILNTQFRAAMAGISFTPITYFALKNLLFPGSRIKMSQAQVPGDLLIVGTFEST